MNAANKKVRHFPPISQIYWHVKKTPRIYGIYPVTNREIRFLVIFYEYLPDVYMHPTMKLFNTVHQLIFVWENFCEVRESLVFVNACISHRDSVFKCVSLVFLLWWNRVLLKHNYSEDHWKTIYIIFSNLSSILFCMFFLTITISNW